MLAKVSRPRLVQGLHFQYMATGNNRPYLPLPAHFVTIGKSTALWQTIAVFLCKNETKQHRATGMWRTLRQVIYTETTLFQRNLYAEDRANTSASLALHLHKTKRAPLLVQTTEARQNPLLKMHPAQNLWHPWRHIKWQAPRRLGRVTSPAAHVSTRI